MRDVYDLTLSLNIVSVFVENPFLIGFDAIHFLVKSRVVARTRRIGGRSIYYVAFKLDPPLSCRRVVQQQIYLIFVVPGRLLRWRGILGAVQDLTSGEFVECLKKCISCLVCIDYKKKSTLPSRRENC